MSEFADLVADLAGVNRIPPVPAPVIDHDPSFEDDDLVIDFAKLLGMEPAPHRLVTLRNLNAAQLYLNGERAQNLHKAKRIEGWSEMLCGDVALLCSMHAAPRYQDSGKAVLDLYGQLIDRPALRDLYLYLLERITRAFPTLVRPGLAMEVLYQDSMQASLQLGEPSPERPSEKETAEAMEREGILPPSEHSPND